MCYIDWNDNVWQKLWQLALDLFDMQNTSMPNQVNPESVTLRSILKDFGHDNSVIAVEVPTVECINSKAFDRIASDHSDFYRNRLKYPSLNVDVAEICQRVLNCCTSTMCAITEAHDLEC